MCIYRGVHLGPWFRFSRLLLKRVKIFFRSFREIPELSVTHLLVKKNDIGHAMFKLISINGHYCAIIQKLFWPPFLKRFFFSKFNFKNAIVFMFLNFEPNFKEKFLWESGFSNFGHLTFFSRKENSIFGQHFETKHFLIVLFADVWLFWVYTHMVQIFVLKFLRESTQKWMGPSGPPPLVHKREWKV